MGYTVLLSSYKRYFKLGTYLSRCMCAAVGFVHSVVPACHDVCAAVGFVCVQACLLLYAPPQAHPYTQNAFISMPHRHVAKQPKVHCAGCPVPA